MDEQDIPSGNENKENSQEGSSQSNPLLPPPPPTSYLYQPAVLPASYVLPPGSYPVFIQPNKSKTVALLLAVFLGSATWLYTYETDKKKFWIGAPIEYGLMFVWMFVFLAVIGFSSAMESTNSDSAAIPLGFIFLMLGQFAVIFAHWGIRIWSIVNTVRRPDIFYANFPHAGEIVKQREN
jgi:hypothetical protein